ncbi:uncharacterized protein LOC144139446 isoform X5 [Haemaphysalis longicornis]
MRDECEKRVRECVFCNEDVEAWEKHKHEAECRQRPGSCQHCHKEFKTIAELEDVHYPQCCQIPVDCSFKSLGCGFVTRRKDMALHELGSLQHNAILVQEIDRLKEQNKTQLENKTNSALSNQTEFDRRIRALEDTLFGEGETVEGRRRDVRSSVLSRLEVNLPGDEFFNCK